jgi:hypothetical protein
MGDVGLSNQHIYHGEDAMDLTPVNVALDGKAKESGMCAIVATCDIERVKQHTWDLIGRYVVNRKVGTLHAFIMGERPSDIPENYVIDHKFRNRLDNRRHMLQWVSGSYNRWNREITGSSVYHGVYWQSGRWMAFFCGKFLGRSDVEREAGRLAARAALAAYPWAAESDLITRHFNEKEIKDMIAEGSTPPTRELPAGITLCDNKYRLTYKSVVRGHYDTPEEATRAKEAIVREEFEKDWSEHLANEVTYDKDGHAVIELVGEHGKGKFTKVPTRFWHMLTFKRSWFVSQGYASGRWKMPGSCGPPSRMHLHAVVWGLLNPNHVKIKGHYIDHVIPEEILNNLETNLRYACQDVQSRNKKKRGFGSYNGVIYIKASNKWLGIVMVKGVSMRTPRVSCEHHCARLLNALRIKHLGPDTPLNTILSDCATCPHCSPSTPA